MQQAFLPLVQLTSGFNSKFFQLVRHARIERQWRSMWVALQAELYGIYEEWRIIMCVLCVFYMSYMCHIYMSLYVIKPDN